MIDCMLIAMIIQLAMDIFSSLIAIVPNWSQNLLNGKKQPITQFVLSILN